MHRARKNGGIGAGLLRNDNRWLEEMGAQGNWAVEIAAVAFGSLAMTVGGVRE